MVFRHCYSITHVSYPLLYVLLYSGMFYVYVIKYSLILDTYNHIYFIVSKFFFYVGSHEFKSLLKLFYNNFHLKGHAIFNHLISNIVTQFQNILKTN